MADGPISAALAQPMGVGRDDRPPGRSCWRLDRRFTAAMPAAIAAGVCCPFFTPPGRDAVILSKE
jgi:hypothetical protein